MKYKQIELRRGKSRGLYFIENTLSDDYQDCGEYIGSVANANIYATSDSKEWKHKLIDQQIKMALQDIERAEKLIEEMEHLKNKI